MLSHVSGSGGPDDGCIAFLLISGPMSTMTSFRTASGRLAAKYIPLRPPMDSPTSIERRQAQLVHHAGDVVERDDRAVDLRGIAVAVAALVERADVEVRLERDASVSHAWAAPVKPWSSRRGGRPSPPQSRTRSLRPLTVT